MPDIRQRRLLLLTSKLGYQTRAFVEAAGKLGLEVRFGTDRCERLEDPWGDQAIALKFEKPDEAARRILRAAPEGGVDAIVSLGDRPTPTAARVAHALGLPHHSAASADACRDKYRSREILRAAGLRVPRFVRFPLESAPAEIVGGIGERIGYPCVVKPLALSGSRGVIRANDAGEAAAAVERIRGLLRSPEVRALREATSEFIQAEQYVEGVEVAVEALVCRGRLRVLAIFDKPDPLEGPFFEETIYVTPSRLGEAAQAEIAEALERAVAALGLSHGPLHAELRLNPVGAWPMEIAARCIGGLCSRALRFSPGPAETQQAASLHPETQQAASLQSLEEVIIRLALGEDVDHLERERCASGVMMIPIPQAGIYHAVEGVDEARAVPGVAEVHITAKPEQKLLPLPEGASYLGFIFARAERPEQVEAALRQAHVRLRFHIGAELPVL